MFSSLRKRIKYLEEVSITKAVLFLAIVPLTVILLNTDFPKNGYIDAIFDYVIMIAYSLIVGRRELLLRPAGSFKKTLNISFNILGFSAILTWLGIKLIGSENPQGLDGVVYTTQQYLKMDSLLPLIGFGEEFLIVLTFLGVFSLLTGGRVSKFLFSLLLASLVFGFLHAFYSPFTAILALGLGHIPFIFATIYYRSILPAVIAHIAWDGFSFFAHYNENLFYMLFSLLLLGYLISLAIPKKKSVIN